MNVDPQRSSTPAVRLDKKFLSHTCPIDPADYAVHWGVDYSIKKKGGGGYFCRHLLRLLSVLAPVQSGLVFALLICNFITRSLSDLWQPLSKVPVLKTRFKHNLKNLEFLLFGNGKRLLFTTTVPMHGQIHTCFFSFSTFAKIKLPARPTFSSLKALSKIDSFRKILISYCNALGFYDEHE